MSLTNHFVFGERRVLVTGQAAGFLNMMAEGMSCAMHSGAIAGESIVESFTRNRDANAVYDELIQSERKRTVDQWNPLKILFDNPHEADLKAAIMKFPLADRAYMVKEMLRLHRPVSRLPLGGADSLGCRQTALPRPLLSNLRSLSVQLSSLINGRRSDSDRDFRLETCRLSRSRSFLFRRLVLLEPARSSARAARSRRRTR